MTHEEKQQALEKYLFGLETFARVVLAAIVRDRFGEPLNKQRLYDQAFEALHAPSEIMEERVKVQTENYNKKNP